MRLADGVALNVELVSYATMYKDVEKRPLGEAGEEMGWILDEMAHFP